MQLDIRQHRQILQIGLQVTLCTISPFLQMNISSLWQLRNAVLSVVILHFIEKCFERNPYLDLDFDLDLDLDFDLDRDLVLDLPLFLA